MISVGVSANNPIFDRVYFLNSLLFYIRLFLTPFKIYYSNAEMIFDLFSCILFYKALSERNYYMHSIYVFYCIIALLYCWLEITKRLQFYEIITFDKLYFFIVSMINSIVYIISIYFVFWVYQELKQLEYQGVTAKGTQEKPQSII